MSAWCVVERWRGGSGCGHVLVAATSSTSSASTDGHQTQLLKSSLQPLPFPPHLLQPIFNLLPLPLSIFHPIFLLILRGVAIAITTRVRSVGDAQPARISLLAFLSTTSASVVRLQLSFPAMGVGVIAQKPIRKFMLNFRFPLLSQKSKKSTTTFTYKILANIMTPHSHTPPSQSPILLRTIITTREADKPTGKWVLGASQLWGGVWTEGQEWRPLQTPLQSSLSPWSLSPVHRLHHRPLPVWQTQKQCQVLTNSQLKVLAVWLLFACACWVVFLWLFVVVCLVVVVCCCCLSGCGCLLFVWLWFFVVVCLVVVVCCCLVVVVCCCCLSGCGCLLLLFVWL